MKKLRRVCPGKLLLLVFAGTVLVTGCVTEEAGNSLSAKRGEFVPWIDFDMNNTESSIFIRFSGDRYYSSLMVHFIDDDRGRGPLCILERHQGGREAYIGESLTDGPGVYRVLTGDIVFHHVPMTFEYSSGENRFDVALRFEDLYQRSWDLRVTENYPGSLTERVESAVTFFDVSPDRPSYLPIVFFDFLGIVYSRNSEMFLRIEGKRVALKRLSSAGVRAGIIRSRADIKPMFLGWNATDRVVPSVSLPAGRKRYVSDSGVYDLVWKGSEPYISRVSITEADATVSLSFSPPLPSLEVPADGERIEGEFILGCDSGCAISGIYELGTVDGFRYVELISSTENLGDYAVNFTEGPLRYTARFYRSDSGWFRESRWYTSD